MPERNVETVLQKGPELERARQPLLHLAIFDLSRQSFASMSYDYDTPTLFIDNDDSVDGRLTAARRIETVQQRHPMYGLPALKNIGRINTPDNTVSAYAVTPVYQERKNVLRNFAAFRRYHLDELHMHVQKLNNGDGRTLHTELLDAAFKSLPELSRYRSDS